MKRAYSVALVVLVALAGLLAGCSMPDYQLDFDATSVTTTSNPVTVYYTLYNSGQKTLKNATVKVTVDATTPTASGYTWTPAVDIGVGETVVGNVLVSLSSGSSYGTAVAYITSAGWDDDDSNSLF